MFPLVLRHNGSRKHTHNMRRDYAGESLCSEVHDTTWRQFCFHIVGTHLGTVIGLRYPLFPIHLAQGTRDRLCILDRPDQGQTRGVLRRARPNISRHRTSEKYGMHVPPTCFALFPSPCTHAGAQCALPCVSQVRATQGLCVYEHRAVLRAVVL